MKVYHCVACGEPFHIKPKSCPLCGDEDREFEEGEFQTLRRIPKSCENCDSGSHSIRWNEQRRITWCGFYMKECENPSDEPKKCENYRFADDVLFLPEWRYTL